MHTKSNMAYVLPSPMPFCLVITTLAKLSFLMPRNQLEGSKCHMYSSDAVLHHFCNPLLHFPLPINLVQNLKATLHIY